MPISGQLVEVTVAPGATLGSFTPCWLRQETYAEYALLLAPTAPAAAVPEPEPEPEPEPDEQPAINPTAAMPAAAETRVLTYMRFMG